MGCCWSLKTYFLQYHLNFFPENRGAVNYEQGEQFHQDIQAMEAFHQDFWNEKKMKDYCWMLYRDDFSHVYKRKTYAKYFKSHVS